MKLNRAETGFDKLRRGARDVGRHFPVRLPPVLVFTDPDRSAHPLELATHLPVGWGLVYRHFGGSDRLEIGFELAGLSKRNGFLLLIGGDAALARRVGADGVHWPERLSQQARLQADQFKVNTLSAHHPSSVLGSQPRGIDARILSAVFPSESPSAGHPIGPIKFRSLCRKTNIPLYALGGVTAQTAPKISKVAGLAGVGQL